MPAGRLHDPDFPVPGRRLRITFQTAVTVSIFFPSLDAVLFSTSSPCPRRTALCRRLSLDSYYNNSMLLYNFLPTHRMAAAYLSSVHNIMWLLYIGMMCKSACQNSGFTHFCLDFPSLAGPVYSHVIPTQLYAGRPRPSTVWTVVRLERNFIKIIIINAVLKKKFLKLTDPQ